MLARGVGALAIVLALTPSALAGGHPGILNRVSCTLVRYYVAKYSVSAVEMWARGHGATRGDRGSAALPWGHACPIRAGCPLDRALIVAACSADDLGLAFVTPRYEQLPARLPRWLALRAEA